MRAIRKSSGFDLAALALLLSALLTAGCAAGRPFKMPRAVTFKGIDGRFRAGQIIDLREGTAVTFEEMMGVLKQKDLLFIGEVHNNPEHHLVQIQILQKWVEDLARPAAAMEFFEMDRQSLLDRFLEGSMSETAFLDEVDWDKNWGFPYFYYRPLMDLLRAENGRVLGVNAPRSIIRKVARSGIESLDSAERARIAKEIDLTHTAHRDFVNQAFRMHPGHGDVDRFEYFYQAQCVWEETMAENIAAFLQQNPGSKLVAFAGNGHLRHGFGIPDRTTRRVSVSSAVVLPYAVSAESELERGLADFVWLTR